MTEELGNGSDILLPQDGDVKEVKKWEVSNALVTSFGEEEIKVEEVSLQESEVQGCVCPIKDDQMGSKKPRDR